MVFVYRCIVLTRDTEATFVLFKEVTFLVSASTHVSITSLIPGRIRVFLHALYRNRFFATYLTEAARTYGGILSIQANPMSGKTLIYFDSSQVSPDEIVFFLEKTGILFANTVSTINRLDLQRFAINQDAVAVYPLPTPPKTVDPGTRGPGIPKVEQQLFLVEEEPFCGLSPQEVKQRRKKYGWNVLAQTPPPSIMQQLCRQSKDLLVQVHLGVIILTFMLGRPSHAILTAVIVGINLGIGVLQERHAESSAACLEKMVEPTAKVRRAGRSLIIKAEDLVPGDIIEIEAGDRVPADAKLLAGSSLEVEEAILSGETVPVAKSVPGRTDRSHDGSGDPIFMGTSVIRGRATAVVCAIGMETEMGKISGLLSDAREDKTPLQRRLEELGQYLVYGGLGIAGLLLTVGCLRGRRFLDMLHQAASLAVAIIPEGLNPIVLIAMAMGVRRIAKKNGIVRKLASLETLGGVTVICSDKTGTLTRNEMEVQEIYASDCWWVKGETGFNVISTQAKIGEESRGQADWQSTLLIGALCNNAVAATDNNGSIFRKGDPTELALLDAASVAEINVAELARRHSRLLELPFDSERRLMTVILTDQTRRVEIMTKGSTDAVLAHCTHYFTGGFPVPLDLLERNRIFEANERLTSKGFRVIAAASRSTAYDELTNPASVEQNLVFCGLIGMMDSPREEAKEAIVKCRDAGIRIIMITGDHPNTALTVANQLGLGKREPVIMLGSELDTLEDAQMRKAVSHVDIFARALPAHKLRIVRALKDAGEVVAMTGDGVNDAPALKEAHVGIAMGTTGTDITKSAADLVIVDDNFVTIVSAVEEGRAISANIRNSVRYLIAANIGEVFLLLGAILAGMPSPLLPLQLLLLNLIGDGLPAVTLANDPPSKGIMKQAPRLANERVFANNLAGKIVSRGVVLGFLSLLLFYITLLRGGGLATARTMAFSQLAIGQLIHVFDCRWENQNGKDRLTSNPALLASVTLSLGILASAVHIPGLRFLFGTVPLRLTDWTIVLATAFLTVPLDLMCHKTVARLSSANTHAVKV